MSERRKVADRSMRASSRERRRLSGALTAIVTGLLVLVRLAALPGCDGDGVALPVPVDAASDGDGSKEAGEGGQEASAAQDASDAQDAHDAQDASDAGSDQ